MTRRVPSGAPCFDPAHEHVVLGLHHPTAVAGVTVTAWLCPVRHTLSAVLEDEREPRTAPGGPLDEL